MKKLTSILLVLTIIPISFVGCQENQVDTNSVLHNEAQTESNSLAPESETPNDLPKEVPESKSEKQFVQIEITVYTMDDTGILLSEPIPFSIGLPKEWTVSDTVIFDKDGVKTAEVLPCRKPAQDENVFKTIVEEYSNYDLRGTKEFDISANPVKLFITEVQPLLKEEKPEPIYPHTYYIYIENKRLIFGITMNATKLNDENTLSFHKKIVGSLAI